MSSFILSLSFYLFFSLNFSGSILIFSNRLAQLNLVHNSIFLISIYSFSVVSVLLGCSTWRSRFYIFFSNNLVKKEKKLDKNKIETGNMHRLFRVRN